ncbi:MAG: DUF3014 domain-containing protein [Pseudohongiellaceae bacterium]|nr:DUF3014 domain-containing protein [Pseudohongiellaceae bacterium]
MTKKSLAIIAAITVVGLLFLVYLAATFESPEGTRTVELEQPIPKAPEPVERTIAPQPEVPVAAQPTPVEPPVEIAPEPEPEPVEEVVEAIPLPSLNESDSFLLEQLASFELGSRLLEVVNAEQIARQFVVFVENVSQGSLPQLDYPIKRLSQSMAVREIDDNLYEMEAGSFKRYDAMVSTLVAVDPQAAMALYELAKPLLQEAYAEIGYRNRDFDNAMLGAIDTVINARTAPGPYQLVKPKVMYVYADAEIESMNAVEKQLLRMGPDNAAKLKAALARYKELLN